MWENAGRAKGEERFFLSELSYYEAINVCGRECRNADMIIQHNSYMRELHFLFPWLFLKYWINISKTQMNTLDSMLQTQVLFYIYLLLPSPN